MPSDTVRRQPETEAAATASASPPRRWYYLSYGGLILLVLALLVLLGAREFRLFHALVEIFVVTLYLGIFGVTWIMREQYLDRRLLPLTIALPFIALLQILHSFTFTGMGLFAHLASLDLSLSLWLSSRLLTGLALVLFALPSSARIRIPFFWVLYGAITLALLYLVLFAPWVPPVYLEGAGFTAFRYWIKSVNMTLFASAFFLLLRRRDLPLTIQRPLLLAVALMFLVGVDFLFNSHLDPIVNFPGHLLLLVAANLLYAACIRVGLTQRFASLSATTREQAEALQQTGEQRQALFNAMHQGILQYDADGHLISANPAAASILDTTIERLLDGRDSGHWNVVDENGTPLAPDDLPIPVTLRTGEAQHDRVIGLRPPRAVHIHWISIDTLRLPRPGAPGVWQYYATLLDITEQKELARQRELTADILDILNRTEGLAESAEYILQAIRRYTQVEAAAIRTRDDGDFRYFAHIGFPDDFIDGEDSLRLDGDDTRFDRLRCTCGMVLEGHASPAMTVFSPGGSAWTNEASRCTGWQVDPDPRYAPRDRCLTAGYESIALIPVRSGSAIVGLLQLNDRAPNRFSEEMIAFLEATSHSIGIALARQQSRETLERTIEHLRLALDAANAGTWEMNMLTGARTSSPEFWQLHGLPPGPRDDDDERWLQSIHPDDRESVLSDIARSVREARRPHKEWRVVHPDGSVHWLLSHGRPVVDADGRLTRFIGIVMNIDAQKDAEASLLNSRALYRAIFENSSAIMVLLDPETGRVVEGNEAACRYYGYSREEFSRLFIWSLTLADEAEARRFMQRIQEESLRFFPSRHRLASGEVREVEIYTGPITPGELTYLISIVIDVTERERTRAALADSEDRYRRIVETALEGIWVIDEDGITRYANPQMAAMLGYTVDEMAGRHPQDFVDEQGREEVVTGLERRAAGIIETVDTRFVHRDGHVVWTLMSACPLHDETGRHLGSLAMFTDISARRKMEEALRASLDEKTVLLQEVHHRVKNNLQIIISLLNMQLALPGGSTFHEALGTMQERIYSMALLHETLYRGGSLARIHLPVYLAGLCAHLAHSAGSASAGIRLTQQVAPITLEIDEAVPCGLIVTELVTNAYKHAFPPGHPRGTIAVTVDALAGGGVALAVSDDGAGMPEDFDPRRHDSLGMKLVYLLAGQLHGVVARDPGPGVAYRITFPHLGTPSDLETP